MFVVKPQEDLKENSFASYVDDISSHNGLLPGLKKGYSQAAQIWFYYS